MSPRGSGIIFDSKNGLNFVYKPGGEEKKGGWVDEPPAQGKEWSVTGRVFTSKADLSGCYVKTNKDLLSPDSFEKNSGTVSCRGDSAEIQGTI